MTVSSPRLCRGEVVATSTAGNPQITCSMRRQLSGGNLDRWSEDTRPVTLSPRLATINLIETTEPARKRAQLFIVLTQDGKTYDWGKLTTRH